MLKNPMQPGEKIDHAWIATHIPHQGSMCLLDQVTDWDQERISCTASSHRLASNPLRLRNQLSTTCGIEYAAQAMAVHGVLLAPARDEPPRAGLLISVREAKLYRPRLDDLDADLDIEVLCIHRSGDNILYQFALQAAGKLVLAGRAAVILRIDTTQGKAS
ncbi:MAG: 3-hydroxylacyl-ACP dehydratase [Sulfuriferula sp.]